MGRFRTSNDSVCCCPPVAVRLLLSGSMIHNGHLVLRLLPWLLIFEAYSGILRAGLTRSYCVRFCFVLVGRQDFGLTHQTGCGILKNILTRSNDFRRSERQND